MKRDMRARKKSASGNDVTSDRNVIMRVIADHFTDLHGHQRNIMEGFREEFLQFMPRVDDDVEARLEEQITLREVEDAIGDLTLGKAPGPNGLGAAFYKAF